MSGASEGFPWTRPADSLPRNRVAILREHLVEHVPFRSVRQAQAAPTLFYQWQKAFFNNEPRLCKSRPAPSLCPKEDKIAALKPSSETNRVLPRSSRSWAHKKRAGRAERTWCPHTRDNVIDFIKRFLPAPRSARCACELEGTLPFNYQWRDRYAKPTTQHPVPRDHWLEQWKRSDHRLPPSFPLESYRQLTFMSLIATSCAEPLEHLARAQRRVTAGLL